MYIPVLEFCVTLTMTCQLMLNEDHSTETYKECVSFMSQTTSNKPLLRELFLLGFDKPSSFKYASYCIDSEKKSKFLKLKGYDTSIAI